MKKLGGKKMRKKIFISILAAVLLFSFTATPVFADTRRDRRPVKRVERRPKPTAPFARDRYARPAKRPPRPAPRHHYRSSGVPELGIFLGGAILGGILLHELSETSRTPAPDEEGYWEVRQEWVAPIYKKVWKSGYRNRHGHYVRGHWVQIKVRSGYWKEVRVWVACND